MKSIVRLALLACGFASVPALGSAFMCTAWDVHGAPIMVNAAIVDVGDEEGEVVVYDRSGRRSFRAEYGGYRNDAGEVREQFVFGFEDYNSGRIPGLHALDLNLEGTQGTLELDGGKYDIACNKVEALGRYALLADTYDHRYREVGNDNNTLAFVTENKPALRIDPRARSISGQEVREALASCMFFRTGAYGNHIDPRAQNDLIRGFQADLKKLATEERDTVKFFYSKKLLADGDTLWEPKCSLMVEVNGTATLSLNGTMMD